MIKFELTPYTRERVVMYETEYLKECISVIESYKKSFSYYGCEINYNMFWITKNNKRCLHRPSFNENYECWFGYEVLNDGRSVCFDSIEGYTLGDSEGFLFIRKKKEGIFNKTILEVTYANGVEDLRDSLEKNIHILKEFYANQ